MQRRSPFLRQPHNRSSRCLDGHTREKTQKVSGHNPRCSRMSTQIPFLRLMIGVRCGQSILDLKSQISDLSKQLSHEANSADGASRDSLQQPRYRRGRAAFQERQLAGFPARSHRGEVVKEFRPNNLPLLTPNRCPSNRLAGCSRCGRRGPRERPARSSGSDGRKDWLTALQAERHRPR